VELMIPNMPFEPVQKTLLQTIKAFLALEKLDLQTHDFRCYLGHGSNPQIVAKLLADVNPTFWPVVPSPQAGLRMNLGRYLSPRSAPSDWRNLTGGIACLVLPTESYSGTFIRQIRNTNPSAIFHLGG